MTCRRRAYALTIFCLNLPHPVDLESPLGHELLQPGALPLELA